MSPFFEQLQRKFHHAHAAVHLAGHHAHRRGFFGFDRHHGWPGDPGRGGMPPGRKLSAADLQLLILALLAEKPRHGYEIIKALDERSGGYYSPSPGMVYPALTWLEEIGHASVQLEGTRKCYHITDAGLGHLEQNREAADTLLEQLVRIAQKAEQWRQRFSDDGGPSLADDDVDAPHPREGRGRHGHLLAELRQARRSLKSALIEKFGAGRDEQRRIAEILERAAAEIRDGASSGR